jgi:hypothetical protein
MSIYHDARSPEGQIEVIMLRITGRANLKNWKRVVNWYLLRLYPGLLLQGMISHKQNAGEEASEPTFELRKTATRHKLLTTTLYNKFHFAYFCSEVLNYFSSRMSCKSFSVLLKCEFSLCRLLFSRLYNVSTSSCTHLTIILSSSSSCLCHSSLLPLTPFLPSVL